MSSPPDRMAFAEERLAKIESFQHTLAEMQRELTTYRETLTRKLGVLQNNAVATMPAPRRDSKPLPLPALPLPARRDNKETQVMQTPARPESRPQLARPESKPGAARPESRPQPARPESNPVAARPESNPQPVAAMPAAAMPGDEEPGSEKRTSTWRKGNPVPVVLTNESSSIVPFQGWVLDCSSGGFKILVDQQVAVGTVLGVRPAKLQGNFPWIQVNV